MELDWTQIFEFEPKTRTQLDSKFWVENSLLFITILRKYSTIFVTFKAKFIFTFYIKHYYTYVWYFKKYWVLIKQILLIYLIHSLRYKALQVMEILQCLWIRPLICYLFMNVSNPQSSSKNLHFVMTIVYNLNIIYGSIKLVYNRVFLGRHTSTEAFLTGSDILTDFWVVQILVDQQNWIFRGLSSWFSSFSSFQKHDLYRPHKAVRRNSIGLMGWGILQLGTVPPSVWWNSMWIAYETWFYSTNQVSQKSSVKNTSEVLKNLDRLNEGQQNCVICSILIM